MCGFPWVLVPAGVGAGSVQRVPRRASAPLWQRCVVSDGMLSRRSEQQHSPSLPREYPNPQNADRGEGSPVLDLLVLQVAESCLRGLLVPFLGGRAPPRAVSQPADGSYREVGAVGFCSEELFLSPSTKS